jgi:predicted MFS family arabinose efflux permease
MDIRNYIVVTAAYWGFTLTDGALRMLVLLHFHTLGYSPFKLAILFLLYELMGILTNIVGGWIGSRFGLKITLIAGLALQVASLLFLSLLSPLWPAIFSLIFVLFAQGLSGIAKDLSKVSSKSAIKLLVPKDSHSALFRLVALLTGSKNALKGVGFFLGGALLGFFGFSYSLWIMAGGLSFVIVLSGWLLPGSMGKTKTKLIKIFSKSKPINILSAARIFLFGARDVWFVVAVPVFLLSELGWSFAEVGSFLALWVIGYGIVQSIAPNMIKNSKDGCSSEVKYARIWMVVLCFVTFLIAIAIQLEFFITGSLIIGLIAFGFCFAINSALHSYLILSFSDADDVMLSVGFYYSANAAGRLLGTLLSGLAYEIAGLIGALTITLAMLLIATFFTMLLGSFSNTKSVGVSG